MFRYPLRPCPLLALTGIVGLAGLSGTAAAGGFALIEHGASGLGNAYAGAAAVSTDSSTAWFNPAGMSQIQTREVAIGLHLLSTDTTWTDAGTTLGANLGHSAASGPDTANPGTLSMIPNFYYVAPVNGQWSYGLSIGAPFGSSTEYDRNWKGRYTTVESGITVIDINPAVSFKVSDRVSLGFGISVQQLTAELGSAVDSGAACLGLADSTEVPTSFSRADCLNAGLLPGIQTNDGYGEVSGDSVGVGFNMGALFTPVDGLKIGVAYRHSVNHELDGTGTFDVNPSLQTLLDDSATATGQPQGFLINTGVTAAVDLPASFSISGAWQMNEKLEWLGDMTWNGWSTFEELRVVYDNPLQPDTVSTQEWQDVWRLSAGLNYTHSPKLTLRAGMAFDEEAVPSPQRRTARIPGNDRTWLSFGAGIQIKRNLSLDVGYSHLFLGTTYIDNTNLETNGTGQEVRGIYDPSSVDILSAQLNWAFN